jgi:hypothetical protein
MGKWKGETQILPLFPRNLINLIFLVVKNLLLGAELRAPKRAKRKKWEEKKEEGGGKKKSELLLECTTHLQKKDHHKNGFSSLSLCRSVLGPTRPSPVLLSHSSHRVPG